MATNRHELAFSGPQRGLNRNQAAHYVGVGVTTFDKLVENELMPPARLARNRMVWDIRELDDYFDQLPHSGGQFAAAAEPPAAALKPANDFV
ncbi:hypothetical protein [Roseibium sediminis]|uniref:hypothetical protein n=1 Tax=Roseibium sediminis TaxID=1775174 RepID=UPI0018649111|nr:hypothetical protein [Roseibium sediminis]